MAELICELKDIPFQEAYEKLGLLLQGETFEFVENKDALGSETDICVVYLMNDAAESFLVFRDGRMTGTYQEEEGILYAELDREGNDYVLILHQQEYVCSIFFTDLTLRTELFNYGRIGHFWVEGFEYLRQLEYRTAILGDKARYLGEEYCNEEERRLAVLTEFPPLNVCCFPAVPKKYLDIQKKDWQVSERAIRYMQELAGEAQDEGLAAALKIYSLLPGRLTAVWIAHMLTQTKHARVTDILEERITRAAKDYPDRVFSEEETVRIVKLQERAKRRRQELERSGLRVDLLREEPFCFARDSIEYKVHLLIWKEKKRKRITCVESFMLEKEEKGEKKDGQ